MSASSVLVTLLPGTPGLQGKETAFAASAVRSS